MRRSPTRQFALALPLAAALCVSVLAASPAPSPSPDTEAQIGAQTYAGLQSRGELISASPLYADVDSLAVQIKRVADPQYEHPFRFLLVHEDGSRAFAVPGGNVYLSDSLVHAVANREELAAVMCREAQYTIAHDAVNLADDGSQTQSYSVGQLVSNIFSGSRDAHGGNEQARYDAGELHFSRTVQLSADADGARLCATAGINPWGAVWELQHIAVNDGADRIAALKRTLTDEKSYSRFSADLASATPLGLPGGSRKAATAALP